MIEFVNVNPITRICVTELSRLGRDTLQVLQTIEILNQNKISLFIQNYNIETLTPEKEINPMSQFLVTLLAEISRMERRTTQNRLFIMNWHGLILQKEPITFMSQIQLKREEKERSRLSHDLHNGHKSWL